MLCEIDTMGRGALERHSPYDFHNIPAMTDHPLLEFFVIGAQKCATTWLYQCLRAHPGVHVSRHKEEAFYVGGDEYERQGHAAFMDSIGTGPPHALSGDVSVNYLIDPQSPASLKAHFPQARIVAILRNPVDRFVSAYHWYYRKNEIQESLSDCVQNVLDMDAGALVRKTQDLWQRGLYGKQLKRYLEVFQANQMLILNQETELQDAQAAFAKVCQFIGADASVMPAIANSRPKQYSGNRLLVGLERKFPNSRYVAEGVNRAHQLICRFKGTEAVSLDPSLRQALLEKYRPDIEQLISNVENMPADQVSPLASFKAWLPDAVHQGTASQPVRDRGGL